MKKLMLLAAGLMLSALFAGCAGVQVKPVSIPVIPPQQLARRICPIVKADLDLLQGPSGKALLNQAQQDKITNSIVPINNAVCASAATVDLTDLQSLNSMAFPALIAIVSAVPAIPNQPGVLLALQLARPLVQQVVNDAIAASKTSAATAASAPVAASQ
jgi:hypothetical protein